MEDWTGRTLGGQFRLERLLGRGGMGHVYLAEQLEIGRRVVVKVLNAARLAEHSTEARFQQEARALAHLNHPNIVHLYLYGRADDGTPYLVMEFVEGTTLARVLDEASTLTERATLEILEQLCSALAEAHRQGVIHRDLKPENVMISRREDAGPRVKILDFGIAKLVHAADARLTRKGEVLGTPLYMAPEQISEHSADARTDIYALGVIGYELLTGEVPYAADSIPGLLMKVLNDELIPVRQRASAASVSPATEALIARCLARQPADRFQSAAELLAALHKLRDQLAGTQLSAAGAYQHKQQSEPASLQPIAAAPAAPTWSAGQALAMRAGDALATEHRLSLLSDPATDAWLARRASSQKLRRWTLAILLLTAAVAAVVVPRVLQRAREARERQAADAQHQPLQLNAWIQGVPFPIGAELLRFEPQLIEARVPASVERTLAFYHQQLDGKWGGARSLPQGMTFADAQAPVTQLSIAPARNGSRVIITRRAQVPTP